MKYANYWRLVFCVIGVGLVGCIFYRYFAMNGTFTLNYDFNGTSPFISEFTPRGRALAPEVNTETRQHYQRLVGEPDYFTVRLPRDFSSVDITLEYQNPSQPVVQLGLQTNSDPKNQTITFQPLQTATITPLQLRDHWLQSTVTFDFTQVHPANPTHLTFVLSAVDLEQAPQGITVRSIKVVAHKPFSFSKVMDYIKKRL